MPQVAQLFSRRVRRLSTLFQKESLVWAKFLSLAATNTAIILCCGHCPVHYGTRHRQALPPRCQEHQPSTCDDQKCLTTSPNVPWGAKVVLVENRWVRVFWIKVPGNNTWNAEGSLFLETNVVAIREKCCSTHRKRGLR